MATTEMVILWVLSAGVAAAVTHMHGGDAGKGALLGLLFGPFGVLGVALWGDRFRQPDSGDR